MSELYSAAQVANPYYNNLIKLWKRMGHSVPRETLEELRVMSEESPSKFKEYYNQWVYADDTYGKGKTQDIARNFDKVRKQYQYNRAREQEGRSPLPIRSLDWDPMKYTDEDNDALYAWYLENDSVPKGAEVYNFTLYRNEYAGNKANRAAQAMKHLPREEFMRKPLEALGQPEAEKEEADAESAPQTGQETSTGADTQANTIQPDNTGKPKYAPSEVGMSITKDYLTPEFWDKEANSPSNKIKWDETPSDNGSGIYISAADKDGKKYYIVPTEDGRYALMWLSDNETNPDNYKGPIEYYSDPNYAKFAAEQYKKIIDSGKTPANKDSYERMFQWLDRYSAWMKDPLSKPMPGGYVNKGDENTWWGKIVEGDWLGAVNGILGIPQELYLNAFNLADQASLGLPLNYQPGMTNRDYMNEVAKRRGGVSLSDNLDELGVPGVIAHFGLETLTDPSIFLPGGVAYDALKARGLADAANIAYAKAFAMEKVLGQKFNPFSIPTKVATEATDGAKLQSVSGKIKYMDDGDIYLSGKEGKAGVKAEDSIKTNGGKTPGAAGTNSPEGARNPSTKADNLAKNRTQGRTYEQESFSEFNTNYSHAQEQITIKTPSNTRTRLDAIGLDAEGNVVINEFKSSATAPLTPNQKIAFPEVYDKGGTVVGKGKGIFNRGYKIPAGTDIKIIRPMK